jgi:hypothetical protein
MKHESVFQGIAWSANQKSKNIQQWVFASRRRPNYGRADGMSSSLALASDQREASDRGFQDPYHQAMAGFSVRFLRLQCHKDSRFGIWDLRISM